jgi:excisionase family DNA binding protein
MAVTGTLPVVPSLRARHAVSTHPVSLNTIFGQRIADRVIGYSVDDVFHNGGETDMTATIHEGRPTTQEPGVIKKELATIEEAATVLTISPRTVRDHIKRGLIRSVRLGTAVRIPLTELTRLVGQGSIPLRAKSQM